LPKVLTPARTLQTADRFVIAKTERNVARSGKTVFKNVYINLNEMSCKGDKLWAEEYL